MLIAALFALTVIDFDTQLLPDDITLPLLWIGLALNAFNVYTDLKSAVIGAMAGYLSLWSVYWLFKLFTGKGREVHWMVWVIGGVFLGKFIYMGGG